MVYAMIIIAIMTITSHPPDGMALKKRKEQFMADVQAIQTNYRGYRFRSRLEARWAVFFDALDLSFEYEKEGFILDDGTPYLPDFWLPALQLWVEIKGELTVDETEKHLYLRYWQSPEISLARRFRDSQYWPVACIVGQPGDHEVWFFGWDMGASSAGSFETDRAFWCISNNQATLNLQASPWKDFYADNLYGPIIPQFTYSRDYGYVTEPIDRALLRARQARFEHGEKPVVR